MPAALLARPAPSPAPLSTARGVLPDTSLRPALPPRTPAGTASSIAHPRRATTVTPAPRPARGAHAPPLASFFGVGAPEALLVGVVALIVFGPKGLAEAVKSVGAALRTFQPTIRELASVSSELRNTLEEQIGLDEIRAELNSAVSPLPATTPVKRSATAAVGVAGGEEAVDAAAADGAAAVAPPEATLSEAVAAMQGGGDAAAAVDPDIEAKRAAAAAAAWGGVVPAAPAAAAAEEEEDSLLGDVPLDALEAELARRRRSQA